MTDRRYRIVELLAEADATDVLVFGGGIIPEDDVAKLHDVGVAGIFTPGSTMKSIVEWLEGALDEREAQPAGQ